VTRVGVTGHRQLPGDTAQLVREQIDRARSYGGTADVVAYATERAIPVTRVWPAGARRD
jgi:hypothetical protein